MNKTIMLLAMGLSSYAFADWQSEPFDVSFLTTKVTANNAVIIEHNHFSKAQAHVDEVGHLKASIPLNTLDTGVDIRSERVRKQLNERTDDGILEITGALDLDQIDALKVGEMLKVRQTLHVSLGTETADIKGPLLIVKTANNRLFVTTTAPFMLNAERLGMKDAIAGLVSLAKLNAIANTIPVTFELNLDMVPAHK